MTLRSSFDFSTEMQCSTDSEVYFGAYLNNFCYGISGGLTNQSFLIEYPVVHVCTTADCSGVCNEFQIVDYCLPMYKTDDQDYLYSPQHLERFVQWSLYPDDGLLGLTDESSLQSFSQSASFLLVTSATLLTVLLVFAMPRIKRFLKYSDNPYSSIEMVEVP